MKLGFFGINFGMCAQPDTAVKVAQALEAAGFDSAWTGEHVVLPDPQEAPSPAPPQLPMLDPAVSLTFVAAHTETLLLGTGVIILPQRNPLVLAKELTSVDVLSKGRLIFGIGVGYLHQEFAALGIPFERRGKRTDEYIDAIRAMWTEEHPTFDGEFVSFGNIDAHPRTVQASPPIVVGGHSDAAFRRTVRRGNGWYGFRDDLEETERCIEGIETARSRVDRPEGLGLIEISITPPGSIDRDELRRYQDLGVDRLILLPDAMDEDGMVSFIETAGNTLIRSGTS